MIALYPDNSDWDAIATLTGDPHLGQRGHADLFRAARPVRYVDPEPKTRLGWLFGWLPMEQLGIKSNLLKDARSPMSSSPSSWRGEWRAVRAGATRAGLPRRSQRLARRYQAARQGWSIRPGAPRTVCGAGPASCCSTPPPAIPEIS
jgi:hypothetical protein